MKKTYLTLIALFAALQFSYAQWSSSGTHIYNTNSGNVGIGTTGPASLLTLSSTNLTDILINRSAAKYARVLFSTAGTPKWYVGMDNDITPGTDAFVISGPTAAHFAISPSGNVGIGITSPGFPLEVKGSANFFPPTNYSSASTAKQITVGEASDNPAYRLALGYYLDSSTGVYTGVVQSTHGGGGNNLLLNPTGGNIAIGTNDPKGYKLAVNGDAIATSMTVKLYSNWPDFVFLKDYKLPTLTDVKTYIDKNKHLPDMPSADEVHANGLNLGEMNRLLLKKVEELTLYAIDQEKENTALKEKLATIVQRLDALDKSPKNPKNNKQLKAIKP